MRRAQWAFLALLSLITLIILVHSALQARTADWPLLLLLSATVAVSSRLTLIDLAAGRLSFLAGGIMAALLVGGPSLTFLAVAAGTVAESVVRRRPLQHLAFNLTCMNTVAWLAYGIFTLLGGQWGRAFNHPLQALAASVAFMLLNAATYALFVHAGGLMSGRVALATLLDKASVRAYLIIMLMGIATGAAYIRGGPAWGVIAIIFVYGIHGTMRRYFDTVQAARSQTQQLEAVLNATEGALIMTDKAGKIQVANSKVEAILGISPVRLLGHAESDVPELAQLRSQIPLDAGPADQVIRLTHVPDRFVHWYRAPLQSQRGEFQGHIEVFTDVTPLKEAEENLRRLYDSMITSLTAAIDARDSYTHGHSSRVSAYAVTIAEQMNLPQADVERIRYSGLLHDIGKLGIDDRVLRKHGALHPGERALMMQHPVIGAEVLQKTHVLQDLIPGVRWHHEWISGGGYPDGLKGNAIPLDARIIGVADALDAMTTDRPYRPALSLEEALRRVKANAGIQFDEQVAAALFDAIEGGRLLVEGAVEAPARHVSDELEEGVIRPVHGKELSIFYQLAREDFSSLALAAMLRRYLEIFREHLGVNLYLIYLTDPETGRLSLAASLGQCEGDTPGQKELRLVHEAINRRTTMVVSDLRNLDDPYPTAGKATRSEAMVPLVAQDRVLGVLSVEAGMPNFFGRDDLYLLEALAERLCSSIKLVQYHEQLAFAATHDGLTGVYNHRYLYERLTAEVEKASREGCAVSVCLLDINGLKAINDTYGHQAGDEALREYGRILKERVREGDTVARYGGDEFAIIMPGASRADATVQAFCLMETLERSYVHNGISLAMPKAAWGIASYPEDGNRATELVLVADRSMYRQKRSSAVKAV